MIKITCVFALALIGVVFSLPAGDSINQRDPVQIKLSNEEENPALSLKQPLAPALGLNDPSDLETMIVKDENLEPAETFGFGYLGGGYGGYSGYGGRGYGGYGWGRRYGNYGGYGGYSGGYGYGGNGWGYGGYGRRYYW